jgi:GAF domain-containing protein
VPHDDTHERALHVVGHLSESLTPGDLEDTIHNLTRAAVEVLPGVHQASISIRHEDGKLRSHALTAPFLEELDEAQYTDQEGPCYDGVMHDAFTVCGDLRNDPRYPNYGRQAEAAGIRSQAGVRIFEFQRSVGALNLYSTQVGALADIAFLTALFTEHARTAIAYALQVDQLREAIASRQRIGQAVGVLMERYQLSEDRAFGYLARVSQNSNLKVRDLADELIAGLPTSGDS